MSITRVTGQRGVVNRPAVTVAPPLSSNFARQLATRRGCAQPAPHREQAPAQRDLPPAPERRSAVHKAPSRPTLAPAPRVSTTPVKEFRLTSGVMQGSALASPVIVARAAEHLLPFARAQAATRRDMRKLGLINETVLSIDGVGDVVVSLYRTTAGWVVRVDANSLVRCLVNAKRR